MDNDDDDDALYDPDDNDVEFDLFQVQGMWEIRVVKDTSSCLNRVPLFTHSQITGDHHSLASFTCQNFSTALDILVDIFQLQVQQKEEL